MTIDTDLIDRLKMRGEEMLTQVSAELMQNPRFMKAMEGALKGKAAVEEVVRQTLRKANIPTRTEFKKAVARIESLESELAELEKKVASKPAPPRKTRKAAPRKKAAKKAAGGTARKRAPRKAS